MMLNSGSNYISMIITCFIAASFICALLYQLKVRKNGKEAEAMVTEMELKSSSDGNGGVNHYYDVHVQWRSQEGRYMEGTLCNPDNSLTEGEKILIRYLPSDPEHPVMIERL